MFRTYRHVDPLSVMQVQNGASWNCCPHFRLLAVEGRGNKHANAHRSWIWYFEPHLRSAEAGIENRQDVIDAPFEDPVWVGVQADIRILADAHGVEIIFVNIADDPHIRKIRDREGI